MKHDKTWSATRDAEIKTSPMDVTDRHCCERSWELYRLYRLMDRCLVTYSENNNNNNNNNSQEPEGKMGSKKAAWTVSTEPGLRINK
jgi:hypothetical protein